MCTVCVLCLHYVCTVCVISHIYAEHDRPNHCKGVQQCRYNWTSLCSCLTIQTFPDICSSIISISRYFSVVGRDQKRHPQHTHRYSLTHHISLSKGMDWQLRNPFLCLPRPLISSVLPACRRFSSRIAAIQMWKVCFIILTLPRIFRYSVATLKCSRLVCCSKEPLLMKQVRDAL